MIARGLVLPRPGCVFPVYFLQLFRFIKCHERMNLLLSQCGRIAIFKLSSAPHINIMVGRARGGGVACRLVLFRSFFTLGQLPKSF